MHVETLLSPSRVLSHYNAQSKKIVLDKISALLHEALPEIDKTSLFDSYVARERLGSTAVGYGVAIPHIRNDRIKIPIGCLIHLAKSIDFGAQDRRPVDIIFALLVPSYDNEKHLSILAELTSTLNSDAFRQQLRAAKNSTALYETFLNINYAETA